MYSNSPGSSRLKNNSHLEANHDTQPKQTFVPPEEAQQQYYADVSAQSSGTPDRAKPQRAPSKVWTAYTKTTDGAICKFCGSLRRRKDSSTKTLQSVYRKHGDKARELRLYNGYVTASNVSYAEPFLPTILHNNSSFHTAADDHSPSLLYHDNSNAQEQETCVKSEMTFDAELYPVSSSNTLAGFIMENSLLTEDYKEDTADVNDLLNSSVKQSVTVNVMSNSADQASENPTAVSLVRWSLALVPIPNSTFFGISVHGIRIDDGTDFSSTEILSVSDGRSVKTRKQAVRLVGAIDPETCSKEQADAFQEGLPPNWRNLVTEQFLLSSARKDDAKRRRH